MYLLLDLAPLSYNRRTLLLYTEPLTFFKHSCNHSHTTKTFLLALGTFWWPIQLFEERKYFQTTVAMGDMFHLVRTNLFPWQFCSLLSPRMTMVRAELDYLQVYTFPTSEAKTNCGFQKGWFFSLPFAIVQNLYPFWAGVYFTYVPLRKYYSAPFYISFLRAPLFCNCVTLSQHTCTYIEGAFFHSGYHLS